MDVQSAASQASVTVSGRAWPSMRRTRGSSRDADSPATLPSEKARWIASPQAIYSKGRKVNFA